MQNIDKRIMENEQKKKLKMLIVEDNQNLLKALAYAAEDTGFEVTAVNILEQDIDKEEHDIVIVDGLGGKCFELLNKIQAKKKIVLSGDDKILEEAKERGYEAHDKLMVKYYSLFEGYKAELEKKR